MTETGENSTQCEEIISIDIAKKMYKKTLEKKTNDFIKSINDQIKEQCEKELFSLKVKIPSNIKKEIREYSLKIICDAGLGYSTKFVSNDQSHFDIMWKNPSYENPKTMDLIINANEANKLTVSTIENNLKDKFVDIDKIIRENCEKGIFKCKFSAESRQLPNQMIDILRNLGYNVSNIILFNGNQNIKCRWFVKKQIEDEHGIFVGKIISQIDANKLSYDNMTKDIKNEYIQHFNEKIEKKIGKMKKKITISVHCRAYIIAKNYDGKLKTKIDNFGDIKVYGWA